MALNGFWVGSRKGREWRKRLRSMMVEVALRWALGDGRWALVGVLSFEYGFWILGSWMNSLTRLASRRRAIINSGYEPVFSATTHPIDLTIENYLFDNETQKENVGMIQVKLGKRWTLPY